MNRLHSVSYQGQRIVVSLLSVLRRWSPRALTVIGVVSVTTVVWFLAPWPLVVDSWLDVSDKPQRADAIICLGAGTTIGHLPTEDGWERLYTTTQLALDDFAPLVVFSGRGSESVSEAELYASAAEWLGVSRSLVVLDASPASTADHPLTILRATEGRLSRHSQLIIVTSALHSRRALLT